MLKLAMHRDYNIRVVSSGGWVEGLLCSFLPVHGSKDVGCSHGLI